MDKIVDSESPVKHLAELIIEGLNDVKRYGNWHASTFIQLNTKFGNDMIDIYESLIKVFEALGYEVSYRNVKRVDYEDLNQLRIEVKKCT